MKDRRPTECLSTREVANNRYVQLNEDVVRFHTGREGLHVRLHYHRRGIGVVPIRRDGFVVLGLHYRYCPGKWSWEIAAGGAEPNEDTLEAARRELFEETGYDAEELIPLVEYHPAPGLGDELFRAFVASGLHRQHTLQDQEEIYDVQAFSWADVGRLITEGRITCGFTLTSLFMARERGFIAG